MDFSLEETTTAGRDYTWLGSTHGLNTGQPGTLDLASFTGEYVDSYGRIKSGIGVAQIAASKRYVPFNADGTDGSEILAGFVKDDVDTFDSKGKTFASGKAAFALLKQGTIRRSRLPIVSQRTDITFETPSTGQFVYAD